MKNTSFDFSKTISPKGMKELVRRDCEYCLKWAQRPSAQQSAEYTHTEVCLVMEIAPQSCSMQLQTADRTCFSFQYLFVLDIFKLSAFCHSCSFKPEAYLRLKTANKRIIRFIQWSRLWFWESGMCPRDILPSPSQPWGSHASEQVVPAIVLSHPYY